MSFPVIMGVDNNLKRILFSSLPPKNGLVGVLFILTGGARGFRAGDWPSSPESDFFSPQRILAALIVASVVGLAELYVMVRAMEGEL